MCFHMVPLNVFSFGASESVFTRCLCSCTAGCKCSDKEIDAHQIGRGSQTHLASLSVSQHPNCTVTIRITDRTNSGENKFKMAGLIVSDSAGEHAGE